LVESQPSKLLVAGSSPVPRSKSTAGFGPEGRISRYADVAQLVERVLGKDEVTGSSPVIGSTRLGRDRAEQAERFFGCCESRARMVEQNWTGGRVVKGIRL
jgi:hypothetical protein